MIEYMNNHIKIYNDLLDEVLFDDTLPDNIYYPEDPDKPLGGSEMARMLGEELKGFQCMKKNMLQ